MTILKFFVLQLLSIKSVTANRRKELKRTQLRVAAQIKAKDGRNKLFT